MLTLFKKGHRLACVFLAGFFKIYLFYFWQDSSQATASPVGCKAARRMGTKLDPVNANSRERRRLSQELETAEIQDTISAPATQSMQAIYPFPSFGNPFLVSCNRKHEQRDSMLGTTIIRNSDSDQSRQSP